MEDSEPAPVDLSDTRRRLWVIVLLTLLAGPFSFVYCGQLSRAIRWQLGWWIFVILGMCAILYTPFTKLVLAILVLGMISNYVTITMLARRCEQTLPWKPYQRWWAYLGIFFAFVGSGMCFTDGIRNYCCEAFVVPTGSMNDTILAGDRILIEKPLSQLKNFERQSIVVFQYRGRPWVQETIYVKRVAAIAGDEVEIKEDKLFVNGQAVDEPYAKFDESSPEINRQLNKNYFGGQVPAGHLFVLGDNRWQSADSRRFGFVPVAAVLGEAKCVFWSREYRLVPPSREAPQGFEEWGEMRWSRIGMPL